MHRTQLLLENWQYEALKVRARREGTTLSEWIRRLLHSALAPATDAARAKRSKGIWAICGIGKDPHGPSGAEHDKVLYSLDRKK